MRFRLYGPPAPVMVLAGRTVPAADGLRVETAGGFRLRCTKTATVFDLLPGGALHAWSAEGAPVIVAGRPGPCR